MQSLYHVGRSACVIVGIGAMIVFDDRLLAADDAKGNAEGVLCGDMRRNLAAVEVERILVLVPVAQRITRDGRCDQRQRPARLLKSLCNEAGFRAGGPYGIDLLWCRGERLKNNPISSWCLSIRR